MYDSLNHMAIYRQSCVRPHAPQMTTSNSSKLKFWIWSNTRWPWQQLLKPQHFWNTKHLKVMKEIERYAEKPSIVVICAIYQLHTNSTTWDPSHTFVPTTQSLRVFWGTSATRWRKISLKCWFWAPTYRHQFPNAGDFLWEKRGFQAKMKHETYETWHFVQAFVDFSSSKMRKIFEEMALNNPSNSNQQCQNTIDAAHLSGEACGHSKHPNNQATKLNHQDDSKMQRLFNDDSRWFDDSKIIQKDHSKRFKKIIQDSSSNINMHQHDMHEHQSFAFSVNPRHHKLASSIGSATSSSNRSDAWFFQPTLVTCRVNEMIPWWYGEPPQRQHVGRWDPWNVALPRPMAETTPNGLSQRP